VEFNDSDSFENCENNVLLLDKINENERVVKYFIKIQYENLNISKPREFLRASLDVGPM
jgi:hypothetical protein